MNHVESIWEALRRGTFPKAGDDELKKIRVAFLQGVNVGREFVVQSTSMPNAVMVKFNADIRHQVEDALKAMGHAPGRVDVGIKNIVSLNGGQS